MQLYGSVQMNPQYCPQLSILFLNVDLGGMKGHNPSLDIDNRSHKMMLWALGTMCDSHISEAWLGLGWYGWFDVTWSVHAEDSQASF